MKFEAPVTAPNTSQALRDSESTAPKALKALLIQAADELDDCHRLIEDAARELDEAAALKIGYTDSDNRVNEVARQIRSTLTGLGARMHSMKPRTVPDQVSI